MSIEDTKFPHLNIEEARDRVEKLISTLEDEKADSRERKSALVRLTLIASGKRHAFGCVVGTEFECPCGFYMASDYVRALLPEDS